MLEQIMSADFMGQLGYVGSGSGGGGGSPRVSSMTEDEINARVIGERIFIYECRRNIKAYWYLLANIYCITINSMKRKLYSFKEKMGITDKDQSVRNVILGL